MKTRTLLLLSVGTALLILCAGGVLLFQLRNQGNVSTASPLGQEVDIAKMRVTVQGSDEVDGVFSVDVEIGGVDDDLSGITLVTGDRALEPMIAGAAGRCTSIAIDPQRCRLDFDTSAVESSNRTLLIVRGDDRANWRLAS